MKLIVNNEEYELINSLLFVAAENYPKSKEQVDDLRLKLMDQKNSQE